MPAISNFVLENVKNLKVLTRSIAWMEESCLRNSNHFILWKVFSFGRLFFFERLLYQNYLHNTSSRITFGMTTTYIFQNWIATRNLKGTSQVFYLDVFSSPKIPAIRKVLFLKERFIKLHVTKIYRAPTRKSTLNIHCKDWCWSVHPILWPSDENWLIAKGSDVGKGWGQEEKWVTEDEMVGWHYQFSEHEFEQTPGDSEGQGSLTCYCLQGCEESDTTWWLNNNQEFKGMNSTVFRDPVWRSCFIRLQNVGPKEKKNNLNVITEDLIIIIISLGLKFCYSGTKEPRHPLFSLQLL